MWNLTEYCASFESSKSASWDDLASSSRAFLEQLHLPSIHPFCQDPLLLELYKNHHDNGQISESSLNASATYAADFPVPPPLGPIENPVHENIVDASITFFFRKVTPYLAFAHLWFRLLAGIFAPLCVLILLRQEEQAYYNNNNLQQQQEQQRRKVRVVVQDSTSRPTLTPRAATETKTSRGNRRLACTCMLGSICSMVVMTDSLYVLELGTYGATLFVASILLGIRACLRQYRYQLDQEQEQAGVQQQQDKNNLDNKQHGQNLLVRLCLAGLVLQVLMALWLTWDGVAGEFHLGERSDVDIQFPAGLYYNSNNSFIRTLVDSWPVELRTYSADKKITDSSSSSSSSSWSTAFSLNLSTRTTTKNSNSRSTTTSTTARRRHQHNVPTPWMYTGDARTGLPFFLNAGLPNLDWKRVFLTVPDDIRDSPLEEEVLALDVTFPETGHDPTKPIYLILHGINGGSTEEYVKDLALRRTAAGSTVVVMVARGLMDMPLRGYGIFNAARWTDVHAAATTIRRRVLQHDQILAGVGFSMGAIILNNYAVSSGKDCALDAAFTISGALDCRVEQNYTRSQRTWLPIVAEATRYSQHLPKWGSRLERRLDRKELVAMMRATNTVDLDRYTAYSYYSDRFSSLEDYYAQQSALGDVPLKDMKLHPRDVPSAKVHSLSIPLCVLQAFDDPISIWRNNAANEGFMRPDNLVQTGNGNLLLLFTETGGHVGWPVGWLSWRYHWEFMSEAAASFVDAVDLANKKQRSDSK